MNDRKAAKSIWSEADRLLALDRYGVMDTPNERDFDDIVKVAAQICGVPMALISLVDSERQWFKAAIGMTVSETPREVAFCAQAIQQPDLFTVEDATSDARFQHNPLVTGDPNLRFYAGAPLETPDGFPLGTLCVLDTQPRVLSDDQAYALRALARQVMVQLELRRALAEQVESANHRRLLALELQHRVKNTLSMVQAIVRQTLRGARTPAEAEAAIESRLTALARANDLLTAASWTAAPLADVVAAAIENSGASALRFHVSGPPLRLGAKVALALALALHELVTNAVKYGALSGDRGRVELTWSLEDDRFLMDWRELGGPTVSTPTRTGFGTRLIQTALAAQTNGSSVMDYPRDGMHWRLRCGQASLSAD